MFTRSMIVVKNSSNFFKYIHKNIEDLNYNLSKITYCYPILMNIDSRKTYSDFILTTKQIHENYNAQNLHLTQIHLRSKSSAIKESNIKKENCNVDIDTQVNEKVVLTRAEKLKKALKEYGSTVIVFHVGISLISLGTCYLVVSSGLDATKIFVALGIDHWLSKSQIAASAGTFAVAYAVHKVFAPVRIAITLTSVPFIVQYLRKIGFLKK